MSSHRRISMSVVRWVFTSRTCFLFRSSVIIWLSVDLACPMLNYLNYLFKNIRKIKWVSSNLRWFTHLHIYLTSCWRHQKNYESKRNRRRRKWQLSALDMPVCVCVRGWTFSLFLLILDFFFFIMCIVVNQLRVWDMKFFTKQWHSWVESKKRKKERLEDERQH